MRNRILQASLCLCFGLTSVACDLDGGEDTLTQGAEDTGGSDMGDGEVVAELVLGGETFVFNGPPNYRILEEDGERTYSLIVSTESVDRTLVITMEDLQPLTESSYQSEMFLQIQIPPGGGNPGQAFGSFAGNPGVAETTTLTITETDGDRFTGTVEGTLISTDGSIELEDRERLTISGSINTPDPEFI
ncbi:MAG: hypothetical protein AAGA54_12965 [Myxococcota bacterium]